MGPDFGRAMSDAIMGLILAAIIGGVLFGGAIVAVGIYGIPWLYHHVSISFG